MNHSFRRSAAACMTMLAMVGLAACSDESGAVAPVKGTTASVSSSPSGLSYASVEGSAETDSSGHTFPFAVGAKGGVFASDLGERTTAAQKGLKSFHQITTIRSNAKDADTSMTMTTDVDQTRSIPKTHILIKGAGESAELVTAGSQTWVHQEQKWVRSSTGGTGTDSLADPSSLFSRYADYSTGTYKGSEAVGHHFSFTLDRKALRNLAASGDEDDSALVSSLGDLLDMRYDLWTNDDFVAVKSVMTIKADDAAAVITTTTSRINQPVTIPAVG